MPEYVAKTSSNSHLQTPRVKKQRALSDIVDKDGLVRQDTIERRVQSDEDCADNTPSGVSPSSRSSFLEDCMGELIHTPSFSGHVPSFFLANVLGKDVSVRVEDEQMDLIDEIGEGQIRNQLDIARQHYAEIERESRELQTAKSHLAETMIRHESTKTTLSRKRTVEPVESKKTAVDISDEDIEEVINSLKQKSPHNSPAASENEEYDQFLSVDETRGCGPKSAFENPDFLAFIGASPKQQSHPPSFLPFGPAKGMDEADPVALRIALMSLMTACGVCERTQEWVMRFENQEFWPSVMNKMDEVKQRQRDPNLEPIRNVTAYVTRYFNILRGQGPIGLIGDGKTPAPAQQAKGVGKTRSSPAVEQQQHGSPNIYTTRAHSNDTSNWTAQSWKGGMYGGGQQYGSWDHASGKGSYMGNWDHSLNGGMDQNWGESSWYQGQEYGAW